MIAWTRLRLAQWGRWCRGVHRTGYPKSAAFMNAGMGDRCSRFEEDMPTDLEEVQRAVDLLSSGLRSPLIQWYAKDGPIWLKAVRIQVSKATLRRRVALAEEKVDRYLREFTDGHRNA